MLTGFLGLNTVPSARMDKTGTIRAGLSTLDPYMHGYIGVQIAPALYINFRQSAETSNIIKKAQRLYPGIDAKLRIVKEGSYRPEISIGLQSMVGHKKMAGEYIALSKTYNNLDFTVGLGWGRMGSAGKISNPLKGLSSHFGKDKDISGEAPNTPANWFTGDKIGLFAGMEYFTPYEGLSLKLDYGADSYKIEKNTSDYKVASLWGIGLSYNYKDWANASLGIQGTDKIFANISLKSAPLKWPFTHKKYDKPKAFYKQRTRNLNIVAMRQDAENDGLELGGITVKNKAVYADLKLLEKAPAPQQVGRAVRHIAMHAGEEIEEINITPYNKALRGARIKIMRRDVENSVNNKNISPQEIWKNTGFVVSDKQNSQGQYFLSTKGINTDKSFTISLENQFSLSEEDSGILYRSSALVKKTSSPFFGIITGATLRLNLSDNLEKIEKLRPIAQNPVRSDIYNFAKKRVSIENTYMAYAHSFTPEFHAIAMAGYLEEFYSGIGGEILYRPLSSRFALGAEIWNITRRDPASALGLGLKRDNITSGFINSWYDLPYQNITVHAKAGRFLANDIGIALSIEKIFKNGAKINSMISLSNYSEADLFGGTTSAYHSLNLTLPLGSIKYIPQGSELSTQIAPFGRDIGQSLNAPLRLFDLTENFTLDHMADHWLEIMD